MIRFRRLQDMPPKAARFCLQVRSFLENDLGLNLQGAKILCGFSGGADSTALLCALHALAPGRSMTIEAAHVNHGLRPDAVDDESFARVFCREFDIALHVARFHVDKMATEKGIGLEQAGRDARYGFFSEIMANAPLPFNYLALGHHLDDQAEDVLMRLVRGAGWPGLAGMPAYDPKRKLIRPLLDITREKVEAFLEEIGVSWQEDTSNKEDSFTRNRVRSNLIPLILKENPSFAQAVSRLARLGRVERDYSTSLASDALSRQEDGSLLAPAVHLESNHQAIRLRIYEQALSSLGSGQPLSDSLFKLDSLWLDKKTGSIIQFPGPKKAVITRTGILFSIVAD